MVPIKAAAHRDLPRVLKLFLALYSIIELTSLMPKKNIKAEVTRTTKLAPIAPKRGIKIKFKDMLEIVTINIKSRFLLCLSQAFNKEPIGKFRKMKNKAKIDIFKGQIASSPTLKRDIILLSKAMTPQIIGKEMIIR